MSIMLGDFLRGKRSTLGLKLREVASLASIDQTLLSRFENGERIPNQAQLESIGDALKLDMHKLKVEWMADRLVNVIQYDQYAIEALRVAESRVEYLMSRQVLNQPIISAELQEKLDELDQLSAVWNQKHPLNESQLRRLNEYFDIEYTFESNRIEGSTLTLQETALVVNQGLTIGGKSMREHLEAINHSHAIGFVRTLVLGKEDISKRTLLEIHRLVLKEVDNENAGKYRGVPVRISGSDQDLPQPYLLDKLMEDYFEYYALHQKRMHPVILAAEMHERLVSIHPFIDGNGRTARLVMNLILLKNGFTSANIKGNPESRLKYYRALEAVQKDANPSAFYNLVVSEALESLNRHLELT